MKLYLKVLLFLLSALTITCKKESHFEHKLIGTWELRHLYGGFREAGSPSNYAAGNGNIIKFDGREFQKFSQGQLRSSGRYTIKKVDAEVNGDKVSYRLEFHDEKDPIDQYFKIVDNELTIYFGSIASDGVEYTYQRQ